MDQQQQAYLLSTILDCGTADLHIIQDTMYDWSAIIERTKDFDSGLTLGTMFLAIVELGREDLNSAINARIEELQFKVEEELEEHEKGELEELEKLDVHADIETYFNYIDTHVNLVNNEDVYKKYLNKEIESFENMTGFNLEY